ncbi:MAG TPA: hypothetical protein VJT08_21830 [Terriglobales bacterium]|nr:hypothetical protein [Terriglobales bacterium]
MQLLEEGDRLLRAGSYEAAKQCYVRSLELMRRLPEAKFRLAVCNLYLGNPAAAEQLLFENIQYTVSDYKAGDPDPVEWAYYILALLCSGKIDEAAVRAGEFLHLEHPELDRARSVALSLKSRQFRGTQLHAIGTSYRTSIHEVSARTEQEWIHFASRLLTACGQQNAASFLQLNAGMQDSIKHENSSQSDNKVSSPDKKKWSDNRRSSAASFRRKLLYAKLRERLNERLGYFLKKDAVKKDSRVAQPGIGSDNFKAGAQPSRVVLSPPQNSTGNSLPNELSSTVGQ